MLTKIQHFLQHFELPEFAEGTTSMNQWSTSPFFAGRKREILADHVYCSIFVEDKSIFLISLGKKGCLQPSNREI